MSILHLSHGPGNQTPVLCSQALHVLGTNNQRLHTRSLVSWSLYGQMQCRETEKTTKQALSGRTRRARKAARVSHQ